MHFYNELQVLVRRTCCISGRYQAGVCSMDGLVFAAGGCDAWNCLSSVEVYDPQTDDWTYAKGMITARRGCGLAVFKGMVWFLYQP
jgi:influenza virus NS1A-binding protein